VGPIADRDANGALRARFTEVYDQYERLRAGLDDLRERLTRVQITAESPDGLVRATVGARGQLAMLVLHPDIYRHRDAEALAEKITRTVQRAASGASTAVRDLVGGYLPAGSGAAEFLQDNDFGAPRSRHDAALLGEARGAAGRDAEEADRDER
jgi:DNA-binding protein YbaB